MVNLWDYVVECELSKLESSNLLRSLRPIHLSSFESCSTESHDFKCYEGLCYWDRASVEIEISEATFQKWLQDIPSSGDDVISGNGKADDGRVAFDGKFRKLLAFSGNDYLGLSSHPTVRKAAIKAAQEHGMGPRGSALICGYTNYHRLLESSLADLKKKEVYSYSLDYLSHPK